MLRIKTYVKLVFWKAEMEEELEKEEERAWCSYYLLFKYFTATFFSVTVIITTIMNP